MTSKDVAKCAHPQCRCAVEIEELYCSEKCAAMKGTPLMRCACGHPECAGPDEAVDIDELDETTAQ
jgi:hypothetical protein